MHSTYNWPQDKVRSILNVEFILFVTLANRAIQSFKQGILALGSLAQRAAKSLDISSQPTCSEMPV